MLRGDWKKNQELGEQREAGNAPAGADGGGREINPHTPQFISSVPWYMEPSRRATVKRQRPWAEEQKPSESSGGAQCRQKPSESSGGAQRRQKPSESSGGAQRRQKPSESSGGAQRRQKPSESSTAWHQGGFEATRNLRGACGNCGALSHGRKECTERPRRVGAKFMGGTEMSLEGVGQHRARVGYEAKRDRWDRWDPEEQREIILEYSRVDWARQALGAREVREEMERGKCGRYQRGGEELNSWVERELSSEDEDEDKPADDIDTPGQNFTSKRLITVRNLRIREDTAKYLRNLDPNSAHYDPKCRAMRENPHTDTDRDPAGVGYAGDNAIRGTGDAVSMATTQLFVWEAQRRGVEVHLQADPTKSELLYKSFQAKQEDLGMRRKERILEKYGGREHLDVPPAELLLGQTEGYMEYSRHGKLIRGGQKALACSKYEEDVKINNHQCVWGSFWEQGRWGYRCCHSCVKDSCCSGGAGQEIPNPGEGLVGEQLGQEEHERNPKTPTGIRPEKRHKESHHV